MTHKCSFCDKEFIKKGNLDRHILINHNQKKYECIHCNKQYSHMSSLSRHTKSCKSNKTELIKYDSNNVLDDVKELLIKNKKTLTTEQYSKLMNIFNCDEQTSIINVNIQTNNIQNTINNTVTNNNITNIDKFHMDIFLNKTCKDAINMSEFMKTIQPTYEDIQNCHNDGIINTISNTVVSKLKDIDLEKRPIHCSDKKRKTLYIKDNDNWNKDINHELIRIIIDEISYKQVRALQEWVSTTHIQMSSEEYTNKLVEITRSLTDDLSLKRCYTKIIGNISESVYI